MPVIRPSIRFPSEIKKELVAILVTELDVENGNREPFIFEEPVADGNALHVIVIWSRWESVPIPLRSQIILEAYRRHDQAYVDNLPKAPQIMTVIGATYDEAEALELFPYAVESLPGGEATREEIDNALNEAGAMPDSKGRPTLKYLSFEAARPACQFLMQRLPKARWSIVQNHRD